MIWAGWGRLGVREGEQGLAVGNRTATPGGMAVVLEDFRVSPTRSPMQVAVTSSRSASTFMEQTCRW